MASGYEIRKANVEEFETIRRMHAQSWLDTYGNDELGITHEWLTEYTDRWFEPENLERSREAVTPLFTDNDAGFYRIALHDGKIIGFVTASVSETGRKELGALYVDVAHHGTGIAQGLMRLADAWIDGDEVELEVAEYNERAKAFYRRNGFVEVEGYRVMHADLIPTIKMVRKATGEDQQ